MVEMPEHKRKGVKIMLVLIIVGLVHFLALFTIDIGIMKQDESADISVVVGSSKTKSKDDMKLVEEEKKVVYKYDNNVVGVKNHKRADKTVHIVQAADSLEYTTALKACVQSILQNTAAPERVTIHIFVLQQGEGGNNSTNTQAFAEAFAFVEGSFGASLQLHPYRYEDVAPFINDHTDFNDGSLKTPGNYVRFLLPEKLSSVERALWLDSDTLVTGDVVPFLEKYGKEKALAAVPRKRWNLDKGIRSTLREHGVDVSPRQHPSFNAGVMVLNLKFWRNRNLTNKVLQICKLNTELNLYPRFGSQPPLQILFSGWRFEQIPTQFVVSGLGFQEGHDEEIQSDSTLFLHWNGRQKPWTSNGLYKEVWEPYSRQTEQNNTAIA